MITWDGLLRTLGPLLRAFHGAKFFVILSQQGARAWGERGVARVRLVVLCGVPLGLFKIPLKGLVRTP